MKIPFASISLPTLTLLLALGVPSESATAVESDSGQDAQAPPASVSVQELIRQATESIRSFQAISGPQGDSALIALPPGALEPDPDRIHTFEEAIAGARRSKDRMAESQAYEALAGYWFSVGRLTESIANLRLALDLATLAGDQERIAQLHRKIGSLYAARGRLVDAREHFEQFLLFNESHGSPQDLAFGLKAVAVIDMGLGRFQDSMSGYEAALLLYREIGDRAGEAEMLSNIGTLYLTLGSFEESREHLAKAAALYRETDNEEKAAQMGLMLNMTQFIGDMFGAVFLQPDKAKVEQTLNGVVPGLVPGATGNNPADALPVLTSLLQGASPRLEQLADAFEKLGLTRLAGILRGQLSMVPSLGEGDASFESLKQALADALVVDGAEQRAWTLYMLAEQLLERGKRDSAILARKMAINDLQTIRQTSGGLDEMLQRKLMTLRELQYRLLLDLLIEDRRYAEAQTLRDMLTEAEHYAYLDDPEAHDPRRTRIGFNPLEAAWHDELQAAVERIRDLDKALETPTADDSGGESQAAEKRSELLVQHETSKQDLVARIESLETHFDGLTAEARLHLAAEMGKQPGTKLDLIRQLSNDAGAPVGLLQYLVLDFKVHILLTTPDGWIAEVATIPELSDIAPAGADTLNAGINALREAMENPIADPRPAAGELYDLLLAPVADRIDSAGIQTLMVHLDRRLRYLPFAALWDGEGWLVERYALDRYTAASERGEPAAETEWRVAGFGVSEKHGDFQALPAVVKELNGIVRQEGSDDSEGVLPGVLYLDEQFSKQALQDATRGEYPILHIASHFDLQPGRAENSRLLLGDASWMSSSELRQAAFRLPHVDLVTLSACSTALGGDAEGIEIEGLGTIFQRQGARGVIASLWKVSDESTARLMQTLYRLRSGQPGVTKAQALRQAQLALMRDNPPPSSSQSGRGTPMRLHGDAAPEWDDPEHPYSHPYFWAPFILMGNWL